MDISSEKLNESAMEISICNDKSFKCDIEIEVENKNESIINIDENICISNENENILNENTEVELDKCQNNEDSTLKEKKNHSEENEVNIKIKVEKKEPVKVDIDLIDELVILSDIRNIFFDFVNNCEDDKIEKNDSNIQIDETVVTPKKNNLDINDMEISGNDSFLLNEFKIEINHEDCLDESPYFKSLIRPPKKFTLSRKRLSCEPESSVTSVLENKSLETVLNSTSSVKTKKCRSSSYNPVSSSSPKKMDLVSPLKNIDTNIINNNSAKKTDNLLISNFNVMKAVQKSDLCPNLIGDFTKKHALPLISGKHKDLKTISPEVLASVIKGDYNNKIDYFTIVDARYPYEYEGGHINGAKNIYRKDDINKYFFGSANPTALSISSIINSTIKNIYLTSSSSSSLRHKLIRTNSLNNDFNSKKLDVIKEGTLLFEEKKINKENVKNVNDENNCVIDTSKIHKKRHAIIFHCEFSSERGPTMYRHLRNKDRELNETSYPNLYHPELYLLHGGYKLFFEKFKELCHPQAYLPMHSTEHKNDLIKFKTKSKSWNCERKWSSLFKHSSPK